MRPERGRSARLACLIALGCLMGGATAATAAGVAFVSAGPASAASCSSWTSNVEGGRVSYHYGVRGDLYVNSKATINAYNYGFVRSLAVFLDQNDWVEVGWSAHIAGTTNPQVFSEWDNNGAVGSENFNIFPLYGGNYDFYAENVGHVKIFRFYFGGQFLNYSPTMAFDQAMPIGNSERHNWCQSLWAHFNNLTDFTPTGTWENWDDWLFCVNNSTASPGNFHYMHKDSASEFHVYSTGPDNLNC